MHAIEVLTGPVSASDTRDLAALLMDAVHAGASVSFLGDLTLERAEAWWHETLTSHERAVVFVARDETGIAGSVQLLPMWAPNQPHRGDVAKLLVHSRARRRGLGKALMRALEAEAVKRGLTLLVLDTKRGDAAEKLYRAEGWIEVGTIPNYAMNPDRTFCDTVFFYKHLLH